MVRTRKFALISTVNALLVPAASNICWTLCPSNFFSPSHPLFTSVLRAFLLILNRFCFCFSHSRALILHPFSNTIIPCFLSSTLRIPRALPSTRQNVCLQERYALMPLGSIFLDSDQSVSCCEMGLLSCFIRNLATNCNIC